mgnify:CR=1 FL=1
MILDTHAYRTALLYLKRAVHNRVQVLLLAGSQGLTPKAAQDKATELGFVSLEEKSRVRRGSGPAVAFFAPFTHALPSWTGCSQ